MITKRLNGKWALRHWTPFKLHCIRLRESRWSDIHNKVSPKYCRCLQKVCIANLRNVLLDGLVCIHIHERRLDRLLPCIPTKPYIDFLHELEADCPDFPTISYASILPSLLSLQTYLMTRPTHPGRQRLSPMTVIYETLHSQSYLMFANRPMQFVTPLVVYHLLLSVCNFTGAA